MAAITRTEENKRIARRFPEEVTTEGNIDLVDEIENENADDRACNV